MWGVWWYLNSTSETKEFKYTCPIARRLYRPIIPWSGHRSEWGTCPGGCKVKTGLRQEVSTHPAPALRRAAPLAPKLPLLAHRCRQQPAVYRAPLVPPTLPHNQDKLCGPSSIRMRARGHSHGHHQCQSCAQLRAGAELGMTSYPAATCIGTLCHPFGQQTPQSALTPALGEGTWHSYGDLGTEVEGDGTGNGQK